MRVLSKRALINFWKLHPRAEGPLKIWFAIVQAAAWQNPAEVRKDFGSVDFVSDSRVIFDIAGNHYRLVARISYRYQRVMIKFIGTHKDYDKIDAGRCDGYSADQE